MDNAAQRCDYISRRSEADVTSAPMSRDEIESQPIFIIADASNRSMSSDKLGNTCKTPDVDVSRMNPGL